MDIALLAPRTEWHVECHDFEGNLKWVEDLKNLVFDAAINDVLEKYFKGAAYTAGWFVGLVNSGAAYAAGDTMAAHPGWTENTNYAEAARPALTLGAVAAKSVSNSASRAQFTINGAGGTIGGAFLCTNSAKAGATGVLYCAVNFSTGNRAVIAGDVLSVTVTLQGA